MIKTRICKFKINNKIYFQFQIYNNKTQKEEVKKINY